MGRERGRENGRQKEKRGGGSRAVRTDTDTLGCKSISGVHRPVVVIPRLAVHTAAAAPRHHKGQNLGMEFYLVFKYTQKMGSLGQKKHQELTGGGDYKSQILIC